MASYGITETIALVIIATVRFLKKLSILYCVMRSKLDGLLTSKTI